MQAIIVIGITVVILLLYWVLKETIKNGDDARERHRANKFSDNIEKFKRLVKEGREREKEKNK